MITAEDFFLELQAQLDNELPFVAYRDPNNPYGTTKAFLQQDSELYKIKDYAESGFVFAPFESEDNTVLIPADNARQLETKFDINPENKIEQNSFIIEEDEPARQQHLQLVRNAIKSIEKGKFKKVVLSRREEVNMDHIDPIDLFKRTLNTYPTAFVYLWYHPRVGMWLGATPETLVKVERNRFKTMALAGTRKFEGSENIKWGAKEKEEQQIVTDSIIESLKYSGKNLKITGPYTVRAGNLLHLLTDIQGEIDVEAPNSKLQIPNSKFQESNSKHQAPNSKDLIPNSELQIPNSKFQAPNSKDQIPNSKLQESNSNLGEVKMGEEGNAGDALGSLISAIHPTPAVCGLPRESARQFILENENYDREFYTGFLGELNIRKTTPRSGNMRNRENRAYHSIVNQSSLFVNLRCMKLEEKRAVVFVGGGITKESVAEAEWEETQNKTQTMKAVLLK